MGQCFLKLKQSKTYQRFPDQEQDGAPGVLGKNCISISVPLQKINKKWSKPSYSKY